MYRLENMKIQGNNSINFGWSCETHRQIMSAAIKDLPQFEKYRNTKKFYIMIRVASKKIEISMIAEHPTIFSDTAS